MDNIRELYDEYKNKVNDLIYGIVKEIDDDKISIDLNEYKIKCYLDRNKDISKSRDYLDGDMIYGCIDSVGIEEDKLIVYIDRSKKTFIEKLFLEQASYMDMNNVEIQDIECTNEQINIYLKELDDEISYESSLDSIISILQEELNINNINVTFGALNKVDELNIVESIDKSLEKGTIINHKEYGVCKIIFKLSLDSGEFIGLKLENNNIKVEYIE